MATLFEENEMEDRTSKKQARVAQWLEHWSSKPGVDSSILSSGIEIPFFLTRGLSLADRQTDMILSFLVV